MRTPKFGDHLWKPTQPDGPAGCSLDALRDRTDRQMGRMLEKNMDVIAVGLGRGDGQSKIRGHRGQDLPEHGKHTRREDGAAVFCAEHQVGMDHGDGMGSPNPLLFHRHAVPMYSA